jgi:glycerol-3-phosphate dehydrogenase
LASQKSKKVDVLVIGGGINGAGIARDLAGRGLSVLLCEKDDLASATSSSSTKLIHGGLRYLEHGAFRLVREALREREVLLKSAPHIIWPLTFVLPHHEKLRPRWMIRLGLFVYDRLGGRGSLPKSRMFNFKGTVAGQALKSLFKVAFSYADCWVEDTRLVILAALDAKERGAQILTRVACISLQKHAKDTGWTAVLVDNISGEKGRVHAQIVVNAAGPWVEKTLHLVHEDFGDRHVRHVKGSHIIVPRLYKGGHAYILQNEDKRVVFVIPYEDTYTLIGTTDVDYNGDIEEVRIELDEVEYLCATVSEYFRQPVNPSDVQWTYSGVRPLVDDGDGKKASAVTRDYILDLREYEGAPILSVYGGKITTFRKLSEQVGNKIVSTLGRGGSAWTAKEVLPGGEGIANFQTFYKIFRREYNWVPEDVAFRMCRAYGARVRDVLRGFKKISDMGECFGDGIYEAEVRYLVDIEWAMTLDDILWRRSKLGLHTSDVTEKKIQKFLKKIFNAPQPEIP